MSQQLPGFLPVKISIPNVIGLEKELSKLRTSITVIAIILGVTIAALLVTPKAHADTASFERDVSDAGFEGAPLSSYLNLGERICGALQAGYSKHDVAEYIYENTKFQSPGDAMQLVNIADRDLCQAGGAA